MTVAVTPSFCMTTWLVLHFSWLLLVLLCFARLPFYSFISHDCRYYSFVTHDCCCYSVSQGCRCYTFVSHDCHCYTFVSHDCHWYTFVLHGYHCYSFASHKNHTTSFRTRVVLSHHNIHHVCSKMLLCETQSIHEGLYGKFASPLPCCGKL